MNITIEKFQYMNRSCEGCGERRNAIISFNHASSEVWLCDKCIAELFNKTYDYLEEEK